MLENTTKRPSDKRIEGKQTAIQNWLCTSAERVRAQDGLLLIKKGDRSIVAACYPDHDQVHPGLVTAAKNAFVQKRVVIKTEDIVHRSSSIV